MERDYRIDWMRAIGTFLVIMAHTSPPPLLQNIRTFDVVMLVFISGMSFAYSYKRRVAVSSYVKKRIKKLVVPTYILLVFLFTASYLACLIIKRQQVFDVKTVFYSFAYLDKGIGYIWIVKVYIMTALSNYIAIRFLDSKNRAIGMYAIVGLSLLAFELISAQVYGNNLLIDSYLINVLPYCAVSICGILWVRYDVVRKPMIYTVLFLFGLYQAVLVIKGIGFNPDSFKYPPSVYYISYGICISLLLLRFIPSKAPAPIIWVSMNSFDIYLSHVLFIFAFNLLEEINGFSWVSIWWVKYSLTVGLALVFCLFLNKVKNAIGRRIYESNSEN